MAVCDARGRRVVARGLALATLLVRVVRARRPCRESLPLGAHPRLQAVIDELYRDVAA